MKKNKYCGILIFAVFLLFLSPFSIDNEKRLNSLWENDKSDPKAEFIEVDPIWMGLDREKNEHFQIHENIFGYAIIAEKGEIVEDKEFTSVMSINYTNDFCVDLNTTLGHWQYNDLTLRGTIIRDLDGDYYYAYSLEEVSRGFFADISIYPDLCAIILAFDGGEYQLCYNMLIDNGYNDIDGIQPPYPDEFEPTIINTNIEFPPNDNLTEMINDVRESELRNIKITLPINTQNNFIGPKPSSILAFSSTYYGIVHECFPFDEVTYPEDLPDDYWEPYSKISIGIYRYLPSESRVKSDLQYYNTDIITAVHGCRRDILAYSMITHGAVQTHWYIYDSSEEIIDTIFPSEVDILWYHIYDIWEEIDCYPRDCIIMVDVCYGGFIDAMADAFVDNYADAFVGATILVPVDSDSFMLAFWDELCINDGSVENAVEALCDDYGGWEVGEEWIIYGDENSYLSN